MPYDNHHSAPATAPRLQHVAPLILALLVVSALGCSTGKKNRWKFAGMDMRKAAFWKHNDQVDPETPTRLVTTWAETTLNRAGEKPKRGFGGRLAFFKNGSEDPIRVDGQLVVYAFDDSDADPHRTEPLRRYVFPAEQLSIYESNNALGPSYNIWLPWDDVGGAEAKVSLIARFEPKDGPTIVGEQTRHYLTGPPAAPSLGPGGPLARGPLVAQAVATTPGAVSPASYQAAASPAEPPPQHSVLIPTPGGGAPADPLAIETIPLPRKLSATPGYVPPRTAAGGQFFTTPHMGGFGPPALAQSAGGTVSYAGQAQQAGGFPTLPPTHGSQSPAAAYATPAIYQAPVLTAPTPTSTLHAQPATPTTSPASPAAYQTTAPAPSAGFQSAPRLAPARPSGR
jgi:hypothetical protein